MYGHSCSHTPTHTHTHTHIDIGTSTMGLPSLQAMGVCVGGSFLASQVCCGGGGGLESCWGAGRVKGVGGRSFLSFTGGLLYAVKIREKKQ